MIRPDDCAPGPDEHPDTVEGTLRQALERAAVLKGHKKVLVIFVDDDPGRYDVRFNHGGGMTRSNIATACAFMQAMMLRELIDTRPEKLPYEQT